MLIPKHMAFIMDGNGRWGVERGLSRSAGHKAGMERIEDVLLICREIGVEIVSAFAWSTENWSRPKREVEYIMHALESRLPQLADRLHEKKIRFFHSGDLGQMTPAAQKALERAVQVTENDGPFTFNFAFNYGGRADILHAVRSIATGGDRIESITEQALAAKLWSHPLPDIDLFVRCGGEKRLSNFMLWQAAYSDIYFTQTYWPDMGRPEILAAVRQFARKRG